MKLKQLLLIVALLAAVSALVFIVRRPAPAPAADARLGQPLLTTATAENIAEIRLTEAGKSLTLKRDPAGVWYVPSYYDFPADFPKIARFVTELAETKLTRLVTTNPDRIERLEFKDTHITVLNASAKELTAIALGKTSETGGRFLRFGKESKAYLAALNTYLDLEPKNWAQTELLSVKPDEIAQIEIPFSGDERIIFKRAKKEDPWTTSATPTGQKLKSDALTQTLNTLTSLRFSDTTELADANSLAAKAHARIFQIETFDKKILKISIGRKPEEKKIKPPVADAKTGLSALGSAAELANKSANGMPIEPAKPPTPEFETIPAGPVFVSIIHSDSNNLINALMAKRTFQIPEYSFTSLPQNSGNLFEVTQTSPSATKP